MFRPRSRGQLSRHPGLARHSSSFDWQYRKGNVHRSFDWSVGSTRYTTFYQSRLEPTGFGIAFDCRLTICDRVAIRNEKPYSYASASMGSFWAALIAG